VSSLRVRPASLQDADAIASLVTQLGYPSDVAQVAARLELVKTDEAIRALVAEQDGQVIGMIGLMVFPAFHRDGQHGYVTALVVDAVVRGSGAGAALLEAGEAWFREQGVSKLNLTTALHREGAHGFYEKRGYTYSGKRYTKNL
jgi:GNAT superfamily N-acetyltransferase